MNKREYELNISKITHHAINQAIKDAYQWTPIEEVQGKIKFRSISYNAGSLDEYGVVQNYRIYDDTNFFKDWFFLHMKEIQEYAAKYCGVNIVYSKDRKFYRLANTNKELAVAREKYGTR